jgi:hypothetical protein
MTAPPQATVPDELLEPTPPDLYSQLQQDMVAQLKKHLFGRVHPSIGVIIPYRETPDRAPLLHWVVGELAAARRDWPWQDATKMTVCTDHRRGEGAWCKATAVANGLDTTDADVLVIHDADCWSDGTGLAIEAVLAGEAKWAFPHAARPDPVKPPRRGQPGLVYRLKPRPTRVVLDGGPIALDALERPPYHGQEGGGVVVLTRDAWETAPLDRRFRGWGQEDVAWALALRKLVGPPWCGQSPLIHLWHEPQPRTCNEDGSRESRWLADRYRDAAAARDDGAAMRYLLRGGIPEARA